MVKAGIALAVVALSVLPGRAQECGAGLADAKKVETARYALMFRTRPARIAVGQHFSLDLAVCPKNGAAPPQGVVVDAFMPEHRHGMNYKASVKALGAGRYEAAGLMFHMPGRWEFRFDVDGQGGSERLTSTLVLK